MTMELVALEYRQAHFRSPRALGRRVAHVADACARRDLHAVGMGRLLLGRAAPLQGSAGAALIFGLRAQTSEGVMAFADALSARGYSGIFTWEAKGEATLDIPTSVWAGLGLVEAQGGDEVLVGASLERIEDRLTDRDSDPSIWMPAPDRFERAADGLFLEQARRRGVDLVWMPGSGINHVDDEKSTQTQVVSARLDQGEIPSDSLAKWAGGDRIERGKVRVETISEMPKRWLRIMGDFREKEQP